MFKVSKKLFIFLLVIICLLINGIDVFLLHRHSHFSDTGITSIDGMNGFFSLLGFFGTIILFIFSKFIFKLFSVKEDYYNDDF